MDKATKLRIRALGLGFLCILTCIPIVMATHWIMGFVAYFPIYHGSKILARKVFKIELPDEAFINSDTVMVKEITLREEARIEKAKKIIKRISYGMAALPFIALFGVELYAFLKSGIWNNNVHWEVMIAPSLFFFIASRLTGTFILLKVIGLKHRCKSMINSNSQEDYFYRSNEYGMSTNDFMHPSNPFGFHGILSPFRDNNEYSHTPDYEHNKTLD